MSGLDVKKILTRKRLVVLGASLAVLVLLVVSHGLAIAQLEESEGGIARASPWVRPYLVMSHPVEDWERDLYDQFKVEDVRTTHALASARVGDELARRWGVCLLKGDIELWCERMSFDANLQELFGFWFYVPNVGLLRSLNRAYGEYSIILAVGVCAYFAYLRPLLRHGANSSTKSIDAISLRRHSLNIAVIVFAALITFSCLIMDPANRVVNSGDISRVEPGWDFYEWFLRSSILTENTIPLWIRYRFSGQIYAGDPQTSTYYISTVVSILSSNEFLAIRYNIVLHAIMSGLFMYVLMSVWKQHPEASLIGAIGYMLSGFFFAQVNIGHLPLIYGYAWMPLTLASFELAYERNSNRYAMLTGFSLSMQLLSGGFIFFLYSFLLLVIYTIHKLLVRLPKTRKPIKEMVQIGKLLSVIAVFTLGIAAIKILPVIEEMPYAGRGTPFELSAILEERVPSWTILQELFTYNRTPNFPKPPAWGLYEGYEYWNYLGVFLLILGVLGIFQVRRDPTPAFLILSTAISIFLALGTLVEPLLRLVPLFGFIHYPGRFLGITSLTIPALATMAVTAIERRFCEGKRRYMGYMGKLIAYGLVLVLVIDLSSTGLSLIGTSPAEHPMTPVMQFMRQESPDEVYRVHPADFPSTDFDYARNGFELTGGQGGEFSLRAYHKYIQIAESGVYKVLAPLNVKYVLSKSEIHDQSHLLLLKMISTDNTFVYLNTMYLNRLWVTDNAILIVGDQDFWESEAIALLMNPSLNPQKVLLVRGEFVDDFALDTLQKFDMIYLPSTVSSVARNPSKAEELLAQYSAGGGIILEPQQPILESVWTGLNSGDTPPQPRITEYEPNWLEASVTLEKPAFLFISEAFIPGWHLYVNGQEAPIYQMDDIFFGAILSEGTYSLRVEFNPTSYQIGFAITGVTFFTLTFLIIRELWTPSLKTRRTRPNSKKTDDQTLTG